MRSSHRLELGELVDGLAVPGRVHQLDLRPAHLPARQPHHPVAGQPWCFGGRKALLLEREKAVLGKKALPFLVAMPSFLVLTSHSLPGAPKKGTVLEHKKALPFLAALLSFPVLTGRSPSGARRSLGPCPVAPGAAWWGQKDSSTSR